MHFLHDSRQKQPVAFRSEAIAAKRKFRSEIFSVHCEKKKRSIEDYIRQINYQFNKPKKLKFIITYKIIENAVNYSNHLGEVLFRIISTFLPVDA